MQLARIKSVKPLGKQKTLDLEVNHKDHNFYAEGLVTSNSHAYAYSVLTAQTIYLKFNYPHEFFLEAIKIAQNKADKLKDIAAIQQELPHFGIKLLPPDLIKSKLEFTIDGNDIRYGLSSIKGISDKSLESVQRFVDTKTTNKFEIFEAAKKAGLNIGALAALIQAGVLDSLGLKRPLLVLEAQLWGLLTDKEKIFCLKNGHKHNFQLLAMVKEISDWTNDDGKKVARKTRFNTIKKKYEPYKQIFLANNEYPEFASWAYEKAMLGYSYSTTLSKVFIEEHPYLKKADYINRELFENDSLQFVGQVVESKKSAAKSGKKYLKLLVADETATFPAMLFDDKLERYLENGGKIPKEDSVVFIKGRKGKDIVWIDKLTIQDYKIYTKLSQLKDKK